MRIMVPGAALAAFFLICFQASLAEPPAASEPAVTPAPTGAISGKVTKNPEQCLGVQLIVRSPQGPKRNEVIAAAYDKSTGRFRAENLPDGTYDLRILIEGGMLDGVDMRLPAYDPSIKFPVFTPKDAEAIREAIANLPEAFADIRRPIVIRGKGRDAKALVEKIRCREFHSGGKGEIIWRVEIWTFEKHTGVWVKVKNRPVICRLRVPGPMAVEKFEKLIWIFAPDLGGLEIVGGHSIEGISVTMAKPDVSRGKVAGSVMRQVEEFKKQQAGSE